MEVSIGDLYAKIGQLIVVNEVQAKRIAELEQMLEDTQEAMKEPPDEAA